MRDRLATVGKKRQHRTEVWYMQVLSRTNNRCHVCGTILTPGDWAADHVVPLDKGGDDDDIRNFLPACKRCNGLKWHNSPEAMRRILFLGVIANRMGYQKPFSSDASGVRELRVKRLIDNWKRRRRKQSPALSRDELRGEAIQLHDDYVAFEKEIENRIRQEKRKAERNRWNEIVEEVMMTTKFETIAEKRRRDTYRLLVEQESPGDLEREQQIS